MKRVLSGAAVWAAMLVLILDGRTALLSAREGIGLCMNAVIPSLFPFLLLSGHIGEAPMLRPLGRLCRVPEGAEGLLIPAFLGGYPLGAGSVGAAYREGWLKKEDAERLLAFSNNCGPAFLFGMAGQMFPRRWVAWGLWGIHLTGAVLTARLLGPRALATAPLPRRQGKSLSDAMVPAVKAMAMICGWVVAFRVVIGFLNRWVLSFLPPEGRVLAMGLLELTNGCFGLGMVENVKVRFLLCALLLALGGGCVAMQTAAVTRGLSLGFYWRGKALQGGFSLLLGLGLVESPWFFLPIFLAFGFRRKKAVAFLCRNVYNGRKTNGGAPCCSAEK